MLWRGKSVLSIRAQGREDGPNHSAVLSQSILYFLWHIERATSMSILDLRQPDVVLAGYN